VPVRGGRDARAAELEDNPSVSNRKELSPRQGASIR
jgi:hypothetical protein